MKTYILLVDNSAKLKFNAKNYEYALNYVTKHYDFSEVYEYITITEVK